MLDVKKLIASAEECLGWPYVSPGSNDSRGIDCSGLFVKIYRDQGASIYHGSNTIYRKYCGEKGPLESESQLVPGMAVFKWNPNTPAKFNDGLGDFQHIGLVCGVNPLRIIHASTGTMDVTVDDKVGKWAYWGRLKDVAYEDDPEIEPDIQPRPPDQKPAVQYAVVTSGNGKPVNLRAKPSTDCRLWDKVDVGAKMELLGKTSTDKHGNLWEQVNYGYRKGWWMMSKFLRTDLTFADDDWYYDEAESPIEADGPCTVVIAWISEEDARRIKEQYPKAEITYG